MALPGTLVWEIRGTGNSANGGAFDSSAAGTDRSQQASAQVVIDNAAITCTTPAANSNTLTFTAGYTPTAADVGNVVNITGGTNVNAGRYAITGQTATTWTLVGASNLTTATAGGSAITGNMGGALDHPATAGGAYVNNNTVWVQGGGTIYQCNGSANVSGGRLNTSAAITILGYSATRGDDCVGGTRPILQGKASSVTILTLSNFSNFVHNLDFYINPTDGYTAVQGLSIGGKSTVEWCRFRNLNPNVGTSGAVVPSGAGCGFLYCEADSCTNGFFTAQDATTLIRCTAHNCTAQGFYASGKSEFVSCLAYGNTGNNFNLADGSLCVSCTSDSPGGNGFNGTLASNARCIGCLSTNATTSNKGFVGGMHLTDCAGYNNAGGNHDSPTNWVFNFKALTADPYANRAGGNFGLNTTTGGGASVRGVSFTFPGLAATTGYPDAGAVQHQDSGTGGGAPSID